MIKDMVIETFTHPFTVVVKDRHSGQVFVTLTEGAAPSVHSPQLTNNDEFDRYQLLLSEAFRIFRKRGS